MRPLIALVATLGLVFLAAPVSADSAAGPPCSGGICDTINRLCGNCIPTEAATIDARCMGEVCDAVNAVCYKVFKVHCVG